MKNKIITRLLTAGISSAMIAAQTVAPLHVLAAEADYAEADTACEDDAAETYEDNDTEEEEVIEEDYTDLICDETVPEEQEDTEEVVGGLVEKIESDILGNTFSLEEAEAGVKVIDLRHTLKVETNQKGNLVSAQICKADGEVDTDIDNFIANIVTKYNDDGDPETFYSLVFTDGEWDLSYDSQKSGAYQYKNDSYMVAGGVINQGANGLQYTGDAAGWKFMAAGKVVRDRAGLVEYDGEWFWIDDTGSCDQEYAAIVKWHAADFLVHGGRLRMDFTGYTYDPQDKEDWYHIVNGQVWGNGTITDKSIEGDTKTCVVLNGKVLKDETPKEEYINPVTDSAFTVIPDDGIDDTAEINHALTVAAVDTDHHSVYLPAGVYDISVQGGEGKSAILFQYEGQKLIMDENAVLRLSSNDYHGYSAILIHADNVSITGGQLIGERAGHSADELGYGHGVAVDRAHAQIRDMKISSNRGDGIYLADRGSKTECYDVTIDNCDVYDNARSNISIVRADDVTITNCDLYGAYGTAPMAGMNIEPNRSSSGNFYCCNRITVKDTVFSSYQNMAPFAGDDGLWCAYAYLVLSHTGGYVATDVTLERCTFNGAFDNGDTNGTCVKDCVFNGDVFERSPITR